MNGSGIPWPGGARCALGLAWDVDVDSVLQLQHPDRGFEQYATLSWLRYDEVAVPNIVRACTELGIKSTFFVPGWCAERYPALCESIVSGGHEVAHHGYLHEAPNGQDRDAELELLRRGTDALTAVTGRRPVGWRAPHAAASRYSMDYLVREGFRYDSSLANDHDPYLVQTRDGAIIELPCELTMSDWPHYAHVTDLGYLMPPKAPAQAISVFMAEFEAAYEIGGFLTTIWHPHVSGRPSRLLAWQRWIEALLDRPGVWVATLEEIARHLGDVVASGRWQARRVDYPLYRDTPAEVAEVSATYRTLESPGWPR